MKTRIQIMFKGEDPSVCLTRPPISIEGPAALPNIGEVVLNHPRNGDTKLSGTVVSRTFSYSPDEVSVILVMEDLHSRLDDTKL